MVPGTGGAAVVAGGGDGDVVAGAEEDMIVEVSDTKLVEPICLPGRGRKL